MISQPRPLGMHRAAIPRMIVPSGNLLLLVISL